MSVKLRLFQHFDYHFVMGALLKNPDFLIMSNKVVEVVII